MRWKNVENDILIGFNYMRASIFNDARNGKMMDSINIRNCFIFKCTLWYFISVVTMSVEVGSMSQLYRGVGKQFSVLLQIRAHSFWLKSQIFWEFYLKFFQLSFFTHL